MYQQDPTYIYQDNQAAIKVLENRRSLSSRTRHIDLNILTARNKIEGRLVKPIYKHTASIIADLGTKAPPDTQIVALRDMMNGYGLVKKNLPNYPLPPMVVQPWK